VGGQKTPEIAKGEFAVVNYSKYFTAGAVSASGSIVPIP
jgi:hypothetical protein